MARTNRRINLRCPLWGWVAAWALAVFLPSAMIAHAGIEPHARLIATGWDQLPRTMFVVADWMSPGAKIALGLLMAGGFWLVERFAGPRRPIRIAASVAVAAAAMALLLALLPGSLSRGFGIGLTGARFDPAVLPFYLIGAMIGGGAFVPAKDACSRRLAR